MPATLNNDVIAGLDTSVMAEVSGAQLMQQVQQLTVNTDRGFIFAKDDLPTVAEITAHPLWKQYLAIKIADNPKVIYGFDATKFAAVTNPPWTAVALLAGSVTNAMLAGAIQLSKLSINPAVPADAGKFVVVNGAGNGYVHQAFSNADGSVTIAKLSVSGGFANAIIQIKADGTAFEFKTPDNFVQTISDNVVPVAKLYSAGINATGAGRVPINPAGLSGFVLDNIEASDIVAAGVTPGYVIKSNGISGEWGPTPGAGGQYFVLIHNEAQNTGAGNAPSLSTSVAINWFTRKLNFEAVDGSGVVVLNTVTYEFVLQAGTYRINASIPGYQIDQATARLFNVTDNIEQVGMFAANSYAANNAGDHYVKLVGEFTIVAAKNYRIEMACTTAGSGNGLGVPKNIFNRLEIYTVVEGWKVA